MPLQNRVTPFGAIERDPARGLLMGNRGGRLHDAATRTLTRRRWASHHWIICRTAFRGRRRPVMAARSYTELFFLDEVTALAAGHRPCYECQRHRAQHFAAAFAAGLGTDAMRADVIDRQLHGERRACGHQSPTLSVEELMDLPNGVMVADGADSFAFRDGRLLPWTHSGYRAPVTPAQFAGRSLTQLTPASTVNAMRQGFAPRFHPSAACVHPSAACVHPSAAS